MIKRINYQDNFSRSLSIVFAVHIALFALFYLLQMVFDLDLLDFSKPPAAVDVIKSAVKVDVVGMPKYTLKELKHIDISQTVTEPEVQEPIKKAAVVENPDTFKEKGKKVDLSKLLGNLSKRTLPTKKKKERKKLNQTALRALVLEGNKVSKGTSVSGDILDLQNQAFFSYVQALPDKVRPFWRLPSYLANQGLQCRVRIYIAKTGKVIRAEVYESSGEAEYDRRAMEAVKKAGHFAAPSKEIVSRVASGEVLLGFPL